MNCITPGVDRITTKSAAGPLASWVHKSTSVPHCCAPDGSTQAQFGTAAVLRLESTSRDGQFVHGLYLEGFGNGVLETSLSREMYVSVPVLTYLAVVTIASKDLSRGEGGGGGKTRAAVSDNVFECPVAALQSTAVHEQLGLVESGDQTTHETTLEEKFNLKSSRGSDDDGDDGDEAGELNNLLQIKWQFRTTRAGSRQSMTIMSSITHKECVHKLMKFNIRLGQEKEICSMLIECCSQERTYLRYFGRLSERFCLLEHEYKDALDECFAKNTRYPPTRNE
ncbi:unnamed protein product [Phytophthora lilii]|uniref:Unnamed protein product n=1 Tax=Phytophthora lilii TaxID=2077276 RepID=A0A9W6TKD5_9STRA|nr:unnamed protein product [Phytophthora lilii]